MTRYCKNMMKGLLNDLREMMRPVSEARILSMKQIMIAGFGS